MAEIRVERKQGAGKWVWIVLLVLVLLAIAAWLWYTGYFDRASADVTTSLMEASWHAIRTV